MTVGFIGQGFVGKSYADLVEARGNAVVRYALETPYAENREAIAACELVVVSVPTPTTPEGFDDSILREAIAGTSSGTAVIIKSTLLPGTTTLLQEAFPDRTIVYAPEFLSEATAAHDVEHPFAHIAGLPIIDDAHRLAAERFFALLPVAPHTEIMRSAEAECFKYAHNGAGYLQIVFFNFLYDLAKSHGADWEPIERAIAADPYMVSRYAHPVHKQGRGAGGRCFIKDFAALRGGAESRFGDTHPWALFMRSVEEANLRLLRESGKDAELRAHVYGPDEK